LGARRFRTYQLEASATQKPLVVDDQQETGDKMKSPGKAILEVLNGELRDA
jgi:hypothetical protein